MSETPDETPTTDEPQPEQAPEPEEKQAPEDEGAGSTGEDEPQVGRRPEFVDDAQESSEEGS